MFTEGQLCDNFQNYVSGLWIVNCFLRESTGAENITIIN